MGVLERVFEKRAYIGGTSSLNAPAEWLLHHFRGNRTEAGVSIDEDSALAIPTVYACMKVISQDMSVLPLLTYRRWEGDRRGRDRATDDHRYRLLNERPNREMDRRKFVATMTFHAVGWGNAYAEVERDRRDRVIGLWPLMPDRTRVERKAGQKVFYSRVRKGGAEREVELEPHRVVHVYDLSYDGVTGISPIQAQRELLGLAKAQMLYGSKFYGRGGRPREVLEMDGHFEDAKQRSAFRRDWEAVHGDFSTSQGTVLLENGMKFKAVSVPPSDAQWVEGQGMNVQEICRTFRVQPVMVMNIGPDSARASLEVVAVNHVKYTLQPWVTAWEQALSEAMFTEAERERMFCKFNLDGLLRADPTSRRESYSAGRRDGYYSANDVLEMEDRNPLPGEQGDIYMVPLNMVPAETLVDDMQGGGDDDDEPDDPDDDDTPDEPEGAGVEVPPVGVRQQGVRARYGDGGAASRDRIQRAHMRSLRSAAARFLRREVEAVRKSVRKFTGADGALDVVLFLEWVREYYQEHSGYVRDQLAPPLESLAISIWGEAAAEVGADTDFGAEAERSLSEYLETAGLRHARSSEGQLSAIARDSEPTEASGDIEARLDQWQESRPERIADREARQAGNAFAMWAWSSSGVGALVWRTSGESCPLCRQLDGKRVPVSSGFVQAGETVDPNDGETSPLTVRRPVRHAPLHEGCDCQLSPG